jgi:hypothetical protein
MEGIFNPYSILLTQLTGQTADKPWKLISYNLYAMENQTVVEPSVQAAKEHFSKREYAGICTKTVKALFDELLKEEQEEWEKKVKRQHKMALEKWELKENLQPLTDPQDHQQYMIFPCSCHF